MIPFLLGIFTVAQNGLNRSVAASFGLPLAIVVNSVVVLALSLLAWLLASLLLPADAGWLKGSFAWSELRAWHLVPGLCGFLIVFGLPYATERLGSVRVFVAFVVAQIVTSLLWDLWVLKTPIIATRVAGALLTVLGVWLVSLR